MKWRVQDVLLKKLKVVSFFKKKNKKGELLFKGTKSNKQTKKKPLFFNLFFFFFAKFIRNKKPVADQMWLHLIFFEPKTLNLQ